MTALDQADDEQPVPLAGPYARAAGAYCTRGWPGPLPIGKRPAEKSPPPDGCTGHDGVWMSRADVQALIEQSGALNIGLRLPLHVIGIDVDNYDEKHGGATLAEREAEWGELPPTWVTTSRSDDDQVSGIRFYAIPEGRFWPGELPGGSIEIIRTGHRYAMVWPSVHPKIGTTYRWVWSNGWQVQADGFIPDPDDLPELPAAWVEGLTGGRAAVDQPRADLSDRQAVDWLAEHGRGVPCEAIGRALRRASFNLVRSASSGSRHGATLNGTARLTHLAQQGHLGATAALGTLAEAFTESVHDDHERRSEVARMVSGAVRLAVAVGPVDTEDPCCLPPERRDVFGSAVTYAGPLAGLASVAELPRPSSAEMSAPEVSAQADEHPLADGSAGPVPEPAPGPSEPPADVWALFEAIPAPSVSEDDAEHARGVWAEAALLRIRREARKVVDNEDDLVRHPLSDLDSQYLQAADLDQLPTPEPLINGILDRHCNMLLSGRDGTYKTFVALDWGLCTASGKAWQGRKVERMRVLYIAGEGAYGIAARVKAWEYAWGTTIEPGWFTVRRSAVNLYLGGAPLEDLIRRTSAEGYGLVVIDTLRRASGGADGNSSEMGVVIDNIARIKDATADGSTLTITHTDKGDNDTRGFSGIEDDSDIVWHATRTEREVEIEMVKHKDGPDGEKIILTPKIVLDSLILSSGSTTAEPGETDGEFLSYMRELFAVTGATPTEFIDATGMARSTVYKARGRLEREGLIENRPKGSGFVMHLTTKGR